MRIIPVVVILLALVFACDTLDPPGIETPLGGSDAEYAESRSMERLSTGGPYLELVCPNCEGLEPAIVPPISTYRWQTIDGMVDPDSVRWILVSISGFNDDWDETLAYIRDNPDAPEWHAWHRYDALSDSGTTWTTPPIYYGPFVFAVHGKEADSTAVQDFAFGRNAVRVLVSPQNNGALVTLWSDFVNPVTSSSPDTPVWWVELAAGTPAEFCWTADASSYCGAIVAYRYAWDIVNPEDDSQWDVEFTSFDGSETCSAARTFFTGTHTFHIEVIDNHGYLTRIPIKINYTPPPVTLTLDLMPQACPNELNTGGGGAVWAALLGTVSFDVGAVDVATIALNKTDFATESIRPGQNRVFDVSTVPNGSLAPDCTPSGPDGFEDLNLKFDLADLAELIGPEAMGNEVPLVLVGLFTDGTPFYAEDQVRIVGLDGDFRGEQRPASPRPDTDVFNVLNEYYVDGQPYVDTINVFDAKPDTVPFGSWIRIDYRGEPSPYDTSFCTDDINKCITYQKNFTWRSSMVPSAGETVPWAPFPPEDNNIFGMSDSTSLNIGSAEYLVRIRSVDEFGRPDLTPVGVRVFGNFVPTLDDFTLQHHDGTIAGDGDSIVWDWWNPANYHGSNSDTLEVDPPNIWVVKEYFFLVKGTGHDHPKEGNSGGVKSWFYNFTRSDDPSFIQPFAQSGKWTDGFTVNSLSDTVWLKVKYSYTDDPGGSMAFAALPDWVHQAYDFSLRGRDTGSADRFDQYMFVDSQRRWLNDYNTAALGRQTNEGTMSFHLTIVR